MRLVQEQAESAGPSDADSGHWIRTAEGAQFRCGANDVLLRAAQRAGLGFPYECSVGACGNCKFELLDGEVAMLWEAAPGWTEKDRQRKRYLGCQARPLSACTIRVRLDPRYAARHAPRRMHGTLVGRRRITHDIVEFRFALERPQLFEPGQYALLKLPGVPGLRAYSMSNAPGDGDRWEFQIRRVPGGSGTGALFDQIAVGTPLEIDGPYGTAWLRRDVPRDILCLAGGSGLAPMLSIARAASMEPALAPQQLHFIYGARTPADVCGEDMLRELPGWGTRVHYEAAISTQPDGMSWTGAVGYLHDVARARFGSRLADMEIYLAGPPAMVTAAQQMLHAQNVPPSQIHFDQFY